MKISVLQPEIIRGDIKHNLKVIQGLIDKSKGDLLVLPEYVLTGSLVFDEQADLDKWANKGRAAKTELEIPKGKQMLMNRLVKINSQLYNCCELLPLGTRQCKLFPDRSELEAGINPRGEQKVFELNDKRFKVIICTDLRYAARIATDNLDFVFFIFHFTNYNFGDAMQAAKDLSVERKLPVIISSLVSYENIGFSSYLNDGTVVSLSDSEGILEIEELEGGKIFDGS